VEFALLHGPLTGEVSVNIFRMIARIYDPVSYLCVQQIEIERLPCVSDVHSKVVDGLNPNVQWKVILWHKKRG